MIAEHLRFVCIATHSAQLLQDWSKLYPIIFWFRTAQSPVNVCPVSEIMNKSQNTPLWPVVIHTTVPWDGDITRYIHIIINFGIIFYKRINMWTFSEVYTDQLHQGSWLSSPEQLAIAHPLVLGTSYFDRTTYHWNPPANRLYLKI